MTRRRPTFRSNSAASRSARRPMTATVLPREPSRAAMARPIPVPPPDTTASLSFLSGVAYHDPVARRRFHARPPAIVPTPEQVRQQHPLAHLANALAVA